MDASELTLLAAVINDAEHKQRLNALVEQLRAIEQASAHNEEILADTKRFHILAQEVRQQGLDALRAAEEMKAALAEQEREMSKVRDLLNAEKTAWETVRQKVNREQAEKEVELSSRESDVARREGEVAKAAGLVEIRETAVSERQKTLDRKHDRLHRALDLNEAEDGGLVKIQTDGAGSILSVTRTS